MGFRPVIGQLFPLKTLFAVGSNIYVKWQGGFFDPPPFVLLENGHFWSKKLYNHPPPYKTQNVAQYISNTTRTSLDDLLLLDTEIKDTFLVLSFPDWWNIDHFGGFKSSKCLNFGIRTTPDSKLQKNSRMIIIFIQRCSQWKINKHMRRHKSKLILFLVSNQYWLLKWSKLCLLPIYLSLVTVVNLVV